MSSGWQLLVFLGVVAFIAGGIIGGILVLWGLDRDDAAP